MLTWQLDRFLRTGPICALFTGIIPALLALLVRQLTDTSNVLGALWVGAALMMLGSVVGSTITTGFGIAVFGAVCVAADVSPAGLFLVGSVLFAVLVLHDLANSFRRSPSINASLWVVTAASTASLVAIGGLLFAVSYVIATITTWQAVILPFGILAIGFAARIAADNHAKRVYRRG